MTMRQLLLLTSVGCTPCIRVKRMLNELQGRFANFSIEEVEFTSSEGSKLAIENNITYPPAVFLDGRLIAKGKIYTEQMLAAIRANGVSS
jgi:glutaredoxin